MAAQFQARTVRKPGRSDNIVFDLGQLVFVYRLVERTVNRVSNVVMQVKGVAKRMLHYSLILLRS
jgi:hypothetical protein